MILETILRWLKEYPDVSREQAELAVNCCLKGTDPRLKVSDLMVHVERFRAVNDERGQSYSEEGESRAQDILEVLENHLREARYARIERRRMLERQLELTERCLESQKQQSRAWESKYLELLRKHEPQTYENLMLEREIHKKLLQGVREAEDRELLFGSGNPDSPQELNHEN